MVSTENWDAKGLTFSSISANSFQLMKNEEPAAKVEFNPRSHRQLVYEFPDGSRSEMQVLNNTDSAVFHSNQIHYSAPRLGQKILDEIITSQH